MNSSPPQPRDGVRGAHGVDEAGAELLEQRVAGAVADRVVDVLEVVQVHEEDGEAGLGAAAQAAHRPVQPVLEEGAVRQAGQGVVQRVVEQAALVRLALADVGLRAGHARGFAVLVAHRRPAGLDPAPVPLGVPGAVLDLQVLGRAGAVGLDGEAQIGQVVGVHAVEPQIRRSGDALGRLAELLEPAGRQVEAAGAKVPVPQPVVRAPGREGVAGLAHRQGRFALLGLADVAADGDDPGQDASLVAGRDEGQPVGEGIAVRPPFEDASLPDLAPLEPGAHRLQEARGLRVAREEGRRSAADRVLERRAGELLPRPVDVEEDPVGVAEGDRVLHVIEHMLEPLEPLGCGQLFVGLHSDLPADLHECTRAAPVRLRGGGGVLALFGAGGVDREMAVP